MNWKSRKLWVSIGFSILLFAGPIVYKHMEISDTVTMMVLGAISAIGTGYLGFNVLSKKVTGE